MLPSVKDLIKDDENCYSFVIAIAKRARQIAEKANEEELLLDEKPVKMAIREYEQGKFYALPFIVPTEEDEQADTPDENDGE